MTKPTPLYLFINEKTRSANILLILTQRQDIHIHLRCPERERHLSRSQFEYKGDHIILGIKRPQQIKKCSSSLFQTFKNFPKVFTCDCSSHPCHSLIKHLPSPPRVVNLPCESKFWNHTRVCIRCVCCVKTLKPPS